MKREKGGRGVCAHQCACADWSVGVAGGAGSRLPSSPAHPSPSPQLRAQPKRAQAGRTAGRASLAV